MPKVFARFCLTLGKRNSRLHVAPPSDKVPAIREKKNNNSHRNLNPITILIAIKI